MFGKNAVPWGSLLVVVLVISAGSAAATSMLVRNPNPVVPVTGSLTSSSDLTVDEQQLTYEGVNVTGLSVTVNNTGSSSHEGTLHVSIQNASGGVVVSKSTSTKTFDPSTTTAVTVSFGAEYSVEEVSRIEVTIEETN